MRITEYRTAAGVGTQAYGRRSTRRCAGGDGDNCGWAAIRKWTGLILLLCYCVSNALGAQQSGARNSKDPNPKFDERFDASGTPGKIEGDENIQQSRTPLGMQVTADRVLQKQSRGVDVESGNNVLQRIGISHESRDQSRTDMVADGTVTVYTANGTIAFGVTLVQNGEHGSQRILLRQPDGMLWDGSGDHLAAGGLQALEFLQMQHARGMQQLRESPKRDATVIDNGTRDTFRVVTVLENSGDSTRYILDPATFRMVRFEFVRGQSRDAAGNVTPIVHSYAFTDVRTDDGVATPFHIEHSVNGVKQEELQLTKVRYHPVALAAPAPKQGIR